MPKHKKDKHAKSIIKGLDKEQAGVPPVGGGLTTQTGANKAFQQQDAAKRQGGFEGAGQHARTGNPGHQ
jgi:hypothetical protein